MSRLLIKRLCPDAILPTRANPTDAGLDLYSLNDYTIFANSKELINTGIAITVPDGTYGRIAPRSGLSTKNLFVNGGVIDKSYTGPVKVILYNINSQNQLYEIRKGDKIAQLILEKIEYADIIEVDDLEKSDRGEGGFGSSGR
jgi:dUTP pyrophosphatase